MNKTAQITNDETINTQRAFWVAIVFSVIGLVFFVYSIFVVVAQQQGRFDLSDKILMPVSAMMFVVSLISVGLFRRGRHALGSGLLFFAVTLIPPIVLVLLLRGLVSISILYIVLMSWTLIGGVLPRSTRRYTITASLIAILLCLGIDFWDPEFRTGSAIGAFAATVTILGGVVFLVLIVRQAWSGNIRVKLVTSFTVIALISVAIVGTVVYFSYRNQVREDIRQRLLNIVTITAIRLDGDLHATLQTPQDMQTEAYRQMMAEGDEIIATDPDLIFSYTMRLNEQGQIYFVIDSRRADDTERDPIGWIYDEPSETLQAFFNAPDRPIVEEEIYTDQYGSVLSAFAPFYRADGSMEGIFGIDIAADAVLERERAVLYLILGTTLGTMILVTLIGLFLGNLFVGPVVNLSAVAKKITGGDLSARAKIETADEIGELAINFNLMTSQLQETLQGLERRVTERTRNLELAGEVGRTVSQVRALDVMLTDAAELIRKQFDLYYVQVYLTDPSQTNLVLQSGTGTVGAELIGRGHRLPLTTASINGRAAIEKKSVVISDTTASATFKPNPLLPATRSEMAVPLLIGDRVVGVLDMQSEHAGSLSDDGLPAFEALAGQLAIAIQNATFLAEVEQARAEVESQSRRLTRANWNEYMDAIHKPEEMGFVFEKNTLATLTQKEQEKEGALIAPIAVTGEALGNLVVELEGQSPIARVEELVNTVARQVSQQIENLRLLETAERYRFEAEESTRRLTREGWEEYFNTKSGQSLSYLYDLKEVKAHEPGDSLDTSTAFSTPLKVGNETIGKLTVLGIESPDPDMLALINAVSDRLSEHVEGLRLLEETQLGQVELTKRARQLAAVSQISTLSSRELDIQKMLETVVQMTQRQFGLYHAHVFTYNEQAGHLEIAACGWLEGDEHEGSHETTVIPLDQEQSLVARAARSRQPVVVNDVRGQADWLPNPLLPDTASELAVPLVVGDEVLGVLDVQSDQRNAFTDEDINIQATLAAQVATALQNARSFSRAQRQAEREAMLNAISQKIQSATSVEAVLQIAARELGHALGAPRTIAQLSMKDNK